MKIHKIEIINRSVLKCKASVDHEDGIITHEWKIIAKDGKLEVSPPQIRSGADFIDVMEFKDLTVLEAIKEEILKAYKSSGSES